MKGFIVIVSAVSGFAVSASAAEVTQLDRIECQNVGQAVLIEWAATGKAKAVPNPYALAVDRCLREKARGVARVDAAAYSRDLVRKPAAAVGAASSVGVSAIGGDPRVPAYPGAPEPKKVDSVDAAGGGGVVQERARRACRPGGVPVNGNNGETSCAYTDAQPVKGAPAEPDGWSGQPVQDRRVNCGGGVGCGCGEVPYWLCYRQCCTNTGN